MWAILYTAGSMILATGKRYCAMLWIWSLFGRAVDPHSFFADPDPDPAVLLNADPDPAAFLLRIRNQR